MARALGQIKTPGYKDGLSYEQSVCKEFQNVRDMYVNDLKKIDIPMKM
jgi:hypothetical protein